MPPKLKQISSSHSNTEVKPPVKKQASTWKVLAFSILPLALIVLVTEFALTAGNFQGTSMAHLYAELSLDERAYVQHREQLITGWYRPIGGTDGRRWHSVPELLSRGFHHQEFTAKRSTQQRLIALGGSTTYGIPYENKERGFPHRLEKMANVQSGKRSLETINAGVAGMDSSGYAKITDQLHNFDLTGLIIYSGNNEVRGRLMERCTSKSRLYLEQHSNNWAVIRLLRTLYVELWGRRTLEKNPPAIIDVTQCLNTGVLEVLNEYKNKSIPYLTPGMPLHRTDSVYAKTLFDYEQNLLSASKAAKTLNIPLWLAIPPINLLHPPNRPQHWPHLTHEAKQQIKKLKAQLQQAQNLQNFDEVLRIAQAVIKLDPTHGGYQYLMGRMLLSSGQTEAAKFHLEQAVRWDYLSERPTPELQEIVRQICESHEHVHCVDINHAFEKASPHGLADDTLFEDFCHPTFVNGVDLIATTFLEQLQKGKEATGAK